MNSQTSRKIIVASGMAVVVAIALVIFALRSQPVAQSPHAPAPIAETPAAARAASPQVPDAPAAVAQTPDPNAAVAPK